jgi:pimeloyl-ACP methyl ester carboxylesterase
MRSFPPLIFLLVAGGGCAGLPKETSEPPPANVRGVVLSVDGAGNYRNTSVALREAVGEERLPLAVDTVVWSHGTGRFFADQLDYAHARTEGCRLASQIRARRQACPSGKIYLVAHSAGSAVVLTAAEALPPGSIDRIVLLAPAVAATYDLRPALRCCPIDVFYSEQDRGYLGVGVAIVGTTDRHWSAAAGRVGFRFQGETPDDQALYRRLRQHPWTPAMERTGNYGGHYGAHEPAFLRAYILPLLPA